MREPIAIAISSFRSNDAVIKLLDEIHANPHPDVEAVIVIDSLGDEAIRNVAHTRGWSIHYKNFDLNIGSAGNLEQRIQMARELGVEWCYCLNHDADWDVDRFTKMLKTAQSASRVGAVYPILDHYPREPRWIIGRDSFVPGSNLKMHSLPNDSAPIRVSWSSSNGALYALQPFRDGAKVMDELWMGYEDLALGITLDKEGWRQYACPAAILPNSVEYQEIHVLGKKWFIPDKPIWYSYYNIRNLVIIRRKHGSKYLSGMQIFRKLVESTARIILLETHKMARIRFLYSGALMGLSSEVGKGKVP